MQRSNISWHCRLERVTQGKQLLQPTRWGIEGLSGRSSETETDHDARWSRVCGMCGKPDFSQGSGWMGWAGPGCLPTEGRMLDGLVLGLSPVVSLPTRKVLKAQV